ncbi:MAG TPA: hypothetical protein VK427_17330 [Kofleriaceae bacterium]|nr:hypothetical protein [Kofleriaceae bacterium]
MSRQIGFVVIAVALLGCKSKETSKEASKEEPKPPAVETLAPKPVAGETPAKAAVKLADGEKLAMIDGGTNPLSWTPGGQPVEVAVVTKDRKAWVRAYTAKGQVDVTTPVEFEDEQISLSARNGGKALHVRSRTLAGRVEGAGAVFAYDDSLITWDEAAGKPVVSDSWKCDETTAKNADCDNGPAWTVDSAP